MAINATAAAIAATSRSLCRECGLDRRSDTIDRIGLLDYRSVVEFGRRRIDVAAGGDHERDVSRAEQGCDRPHVLALQVDVEDGQIESALFDLVERTLHRVARPTDLMPEGIEKILEHHRNQWLVLDNEDGTPLRHRGRDSCAGRMRKAII